MFNIIRCNAVWKRDNPVNTTMMSSLANRFSEYIRPKWLMTLPSSLPLRVPNICHWPGLQIERISSMSGDIGQSSPALNDLGAQIDRTSGTRRWIILPFHSQAMGGGQK